MAVREWLGQSDDGRSDDVDQLMVCAQQSMQSCDFRSAEAFLSEARSLDQGIEIWLLSGQCFLFQGQPEAAVPMYQQAWETGKHRYCLNSCWKACFGLSQAYSELGEPSLAQQFSSLALTAVMKAVSSGILEQLPEEVLLANAIFRRSSGDREGAVADLEWIRKSTRNPCLQAEAEFALAELQPGWRGIATLRACSRRFRHAGNLSGALRALEHQSERELAIGEWSMGRNTLREAGRIAVRLGIRTKIALYQQLVARLQQSLAVFHGESQWN